MQHRRSTTLRLGSLFKASIKSWFLALTALITKQELWRSAMAQRKPLMQRNLMFMHSMLHCVRLNVHFAAFLKTTRLKMYVSNQAVPVNLTFLTYHFRASLSHSLWGNTSQVLLNSFLILRISLRTPPQTRLRGNRPPRLKVVQIRQLRKCKDYRCEVLDFNGTTKFYWMLLTFSMYIVYWYYLLYWLLSDKEIEIVCYSSRHVSVLPWLSWGDAILVPVTLKKIRQCILYRGWDLAS